MTHRQSARPRRTFLSSVVVTALALALPVPLVAQDAAACRPARGAATEWIARAIATVIPAGDSVLHFHAMQAVEQNFQSDRTYPPFFSAMSSEEIWVDPASGLERAATSGVYPGWGPSPVRVRLTTGRASWLVRDSTPVPVPPLHRSATIERSLNPWAVLHDWRDAEGVRVERECRYRDYWRVVLARETPDGTERLFVDPKTAVPVKLERTEPHYLWGQVTVEYLWSNWKLVGGGAYPTSSFRLVDGATEISRTLGAVELAARDGAPDLAVPDTTLRMAASDLPMFLQPLPPDTVRIGPAAFLLVNRGYTQAVALVRDTVFVLDATQGEERARQDSVWIGRLFPGRHPVAVVVTDLAWPHIAGVRYWVATGATIISHRMSRPFLERVIARRWTARPDLLERRRGQARLRFRAVDDSLSLAGGDLRLYAIDGIGSEGALMAWLPRDRFLWASDYIQSVDEPSLYAAEVWRAARRAGLEPARTAAQHLPLTEWAVVDRLVAPVGGSATGAP